MTLTELQTLVREHARTGDLTITSGKGLAHANFVYRQAATLVKFEDLTRVQTDSRFVTTAATGTYTFDFSPYYIDLTLVEVEDYADGNKYKRIVPSPSERLWQAADHEPDELPRIYRFHAGKVTSIFEVRPRPKVSSAQFRFTGIMEPDEFVSASDQTPFRRKYDDDILACLIAAYELAKQGDQVRANQVFAMAARSIRDTTGIEIRPAEMREKFDV